VTLAIALAAFVTAVPALVLALVVMRQNAETTAELRQHRRAHARAAGAADPDRRISDQGPPDGLERRTPNREQRHELATSQLEQVDLPTTQIAAQPQRPGPTSGATDPRRQS
jgi:hypothetical protein